MEARAERGGGVGGGLVLLGGVAREAFAQEAVEDTEGVRAAAASGAGRQGRRGSERSFPVRESFTSSPDRWPPAPGPVPSSFPDPGSLSPGLRLKEAREQDSGS